MTLTAAMQPLLRAVSLVVVLILAPVPALAQAPVRIVSFNIRYGTAADGDHVWPNRRHAVVGTIRDHAPHLLGVQEALRFQLDELEAALPLHRRFGVGRDDGIAAGEHAALLVDTTRFAVLEDGTYWLSDTPGVPGSMHWGNRITRIVSWVRMTDRATGRVWRAYNAHWDHESQVSRERSAQLMLERIRQDGSPTDAVVVLGDFNADESNPAFQSLLGSAPARLADSFRSRHPSARTVGTFNAFRGDSTAGKIDAVLVGAGISVIDAGIDRRRWGRMWASDHFAVWAVVTAP